LNIVATWGQALRVKRNRLVLAGVIFLVFVTVSSSIVFGAEAQNRTSFSTSDRFVIPELNGSIRFAYNGSYSSAVLENNTWVFSDLMINTTRLLGNLKVSVQDSDITIFSFYSSSNISMARQSVRYNAQGVGSQVFDLGVEGATHHSEWWVTVGSLSTVFLAQGREWRLSPDNIVTVKGQTGNISVTHFSFDAQSNSSLPFMERHSVLLVTLAVVAVTAIAASVVSVKVRRNTRGSN
jgi:hypothetical protein